MGFGLENYDVGGQFRTHDDGHPECPIDGAGDLPGYGTFSGPGQLAQILVSSNVLEHCLVRQLYTYAVGRELRSEEDAAVADLATRFQANGRSMAELLELLGQRRHDPLLPTHQRPEAAGDECQAKHGVNGVLMMRCR